MAWRFLPFKSKLSTSVKATRKKIDLSLKNFDIYPPEGHNCIKLSEKWEEDGSSIQEFAFFGGARRTTEASWGFGKEFYVMNFLVDETDVTLQSIDTISTQGSEFPPLQSPASCIIDKNIYVWGGLHLDSFTTINDLFVINTNEKKWKIMIVQCGPNAISKNVQKGVAIPSGRTGHSLNIVNDETVILHGGLTFGNRDTSGKSLTSVFSQTCNDGAFYALNTNTFEWSILDNIPEIKPRAYHTATNLLSSGDLRIIYHGGICYDGSTPVERLPINEFVVLTFKFCHMENVVIEKIVIPITINKFISYHSTLPHRGTLYIVGGYVQNERAMTQDAPDLNQQMMICDLENKTYENVNIDPLYITAGHSAFPLSEDCLMFVGGIIDALFVYTTKAMKPSPCDLSVSCKIDESPEISPISWIQCEGQCKRWMHQFCVNLLYKQLPKGKYICQDCKTKSRKRKN